MVNKWTDRDNQYLKRVYGEISASIISIDLYRSIPSIYQQARKLGLSAMRSLDERFWDKVEKTDSCWNWTAYTDGNGYGLLFFGTKKNPKPRSAHRISYEIHNGSVPDGMNVLHKCDNRKCVNPAHLFLGTQSDNLVDALKKGRAPGMKLCEVDVKLILSLKDTTLKEVADWFGVSMSQICNIRNRKQWKYI